jgi:periplasmic protein TonB
MNEEFSKTRFALPIAVTLATHAFLFFGFNRPEVVPVPKEKPVPPEIITRPVPVDLVDPPPTPNESDEPAAAARALPAYASIPEPPAAHTPQSGITVEITPSTPGPAPVDTRIIPSSFSSGPGDPNGPFGAPSTIVRISELDETPRVKFSVPPEYPYTMKSAGISGEVWVEFIVGEDGRVLNARVARSTHSDFEAPTLRAVYKWKFASGKRDGRAVRYRMSLPVVFSLGQDI